MQVRRCAAQQTGRGGYQSSGGRGGGSYPSQGSGNSGRGGGRGYQGGNSPNYQGTRGRGGGNYQSGRGNSSQQWTPRAPPPVEEDLYEEEGVRSGRKDDSEPLMNTDIRWASGPLCGYNLEV